MPDTAARSTLVDDIADRIREMILNREIEPGQLLPTRKELAAQFGVGIATIHEAVKSLAAVGLVESRPGRGTWVSSNALNSVIHPDVITNRLGQIDSETIYQARLVLEVALAELAAQNATPEEVAEMWRHLDDTQASLDDDETFMEADWNFHLVVARAAHNKLLEAFYHLSRELLYEFIEDAIKLPRVKEEASQYHIAQARAIEEHNVADARRIAYEHMLYVKERLMG